jgi:hypothetical protein
MVFDPNGYTNGYTDCRLIGAALFEGSGLLAAHLHRHAFVHSRAYEIPNGKQSCVARLPRLLRERIGEAQLDERLPRYPDARRLAINRVEQVDREVDVHPLDLTPRAAHLGVIDIGFQVAGGIIDRKVGQAVEFFSRDGFRRRRGIGLSPTRARVGPR